MEANSILENSSYHCSPEFHLARMPGSAAIIYPFALRLSGKTGVFHASAVTMSRYFGISHSTVLRALQTLEEHQFFVRVATEKFRPTKYRVLSHKQWAADH